MPLPPLLRVRDGKLLTHGGKLLTGPNWAPDPDPDYCGCCACDPGPICINATGETKNCRLPRYVTIEFAGITLDSSPCVKSFPEFVTFNASVFGTGCDGGGYCGPFTGSGVGGSPCGYSLKNHGSFDPNITVVDPFSSEVCGWLGQILAPDDTSFATCLHDYCTCHDYSTCSQGVDWAVFLDHTTMKLWALIYNRFGFILNDAWPFSESEEGDPSHTLGDNKGCYFIGSVDYTCIPKLPSDSIVISNTAVVGDTVDWPIRWDSNFLDDLWIMGSGGTCTITCRKQVLA